MQLRSVALRLSLPIVALATLASAPATSAAENPAGCPNGHWPASVQGRPTNFEAGAAAGDYVWHDSAGWHVRVTHHGDDRLVFSGRIVASEPLSSAPVALEKADLLSLSSDRRTISFRFTNYGAVDGFDFTTACAHRLTFRFEIAGARTPVGRIWLGHGNRHPLENPLVVTRIG